MIHWAWAPLVAHLHCILARPQLNRLSQSHKEVTRLGCFPTARHGCLPTKRFLFSDCWQANLLGFCHPLESGGDPREVSPGTGTGEVGWEGEGMNSNRMCPDLTLPLFLKCLELLPDKTAGSLKSPHPRTEMGPLRRCLQLLHPIPTFNYH